MARMTVFAGAFLAPLLLLASAAMAQPQPTPPIQPPQDEASDGLDEPVQPPVFRPRPPAPPKAEDEPEMEPVIITGRRIRGADAAPLPPRVLTPEDLEP